MDCLPVEQIFTESLKGKAVDCVSFLGGDTFGCSFESGAGFTIMSLCRINTGVISLQTGQAGFRAALRDLIGQRLASFENATDHFLMQFENGVLLDFSNHPDHFKPPEAAIFSYQDCTIIWRGPDD